jgi:hypothetical protein
MIFTNTKNGINKLWFQRIVVLESKDSLEKRIDGMNDSVCRWNVRC